MTLLLCYTAIACRTLTYIKVDFTLDTKYSNLKMKKKNIAITIVVMCILLIKKAKKSMFLVILLYFFTPNLKK